MRNWIETGDSSGGAIQLLADRRSGVIVVHAGNLKAIYGRWFPYQGNLLTSYWDQWYRPSGGDVCELFYHCPFGMPGYLVLDYIRSSSTTQLSSIYVAGLVLDHIAKLKGCMAILCHVTNDRISDRFLNRWGWERHCQHWQGRHFIKRFYGSYPPAPYPWNVRIGLPDNELNRRESNGTTSIVPEHTA